ncbi:MAG: hypothetical protein IKZ45_09580 [Fibrobacter sp.]|nr:hypothetical protein [Fibrobacter sp.]
MIKVAKFGDWGGNKKIFLKYALFALFWGALQKPYALRFFRPDSLSIFFDPTL